MDDFARHLSRRERQIMDAVYAAGGQGATAADIAARLPEPPTQTAVRTMLRILVDKRHLATRKAGRRLVYRPTRASGPAGRSALRGLLATFFGGSIENAVAAHLADPKAGLSPDELERLRALIDAAARKGR